MHHIVPFKQSSPQHQLADLYGRRNHQPAEAGPAQPQPSAPRRGEQKAQGQEEDHIQDVFQQQPPVSLQKDFLPGPEQIQPVAGRRLRPPGKNR